MPTPGEGDRITVTLTRCTGQRNREILSFFLWLFKDRTKTFRKLWKGLGWLKEMVVLLFLISQVFSKAQKLCPWHCSSQTPSSPFWCTWECFGATSSRVPIACVRNKPWVWSLQSCSVWGVRGSFGPEALFAPYSRVKRRCSLENCWPLGCWGREELPTNSK